MGLSDKVLVPGADIADRHSWMTFPLLFASAELRQSAQKAIEEGGVETRPIIVGNVLRHPLVQWLDLSTSQPDLPNCDAVFERGMMIGLNPMSTDEEESFIIDVLRGSVERA
jgi:CDP-6-deoxy-D-xylo-4-hexulose-3-dehydrase